MTWDWLPEYGPRFISGVWITLKLLVISLVLGSLLAIPVAYVQVRGPRVLGWLARGFCTVIRGTPLLIQLWLIYYGLGSVFPSIEGIRDSFLWPILRDAFPYAIFAFTLSVAGYQGEILRAALQGVPKGEIEAARAYGLKGFPLLFRIWLPRAYQNVLPTLAGECVLTLKSTPLAANVFGVGTIVRQETYRVYEPLLFIAAIYMLITACIVLLFRWLESRVPPV